MNRFVNQAVYIVVAAAPQVSQTKDVPNLSLQLPTIVETSRSSLLAGRLRNLYSELQFDSVGPVAGPCKSSKANCLTFPLVSARRKTNGQPANTVGRWRNNFEADLALIKFV
ncbi:predicted protein [Histoplasma capsulatum G186AR]|uniref:Uncharacterized protein n=1 Tax=Ajellomyces capsulatus (strain G186AR / H82 / ATCC MYA-2454 / RMSCC 2432) TaxID=447093 RepID=C0NSP9_AJECG|nr:uncharacterized protein HCBG_06179 [Histoplasma capsulatum G186AR]EEH05915.1 predicted protein [Histoplasma capsulatum G186AR]